MGLTGTIPVSVSDLVDLDFLRLHFNELVGPIPVELAQLEGLALLNFRDNQLTGAIPTGTFVCMT